MTEGVIALLAIGVAGLIFFLTARVRASQQSIANEALQTPEGEAVDKEAEVVMEVQYVCEVGKIHARALLDLIHNDGIDAERIDYERARYSDLREKALLLIESLQDDFYKGAALHRVIRLCMECGERERAGTLLRSIVDEFIREKVLEEFPSLKLAG